MIDVTHFSKIYDDHLAVDDLSFHLQPGKICGLVGPNGAGKTTTLRCLAGLIPATRGSLQVAGFDVEINALSVKQRLAYVPDDPPLFDDLTVGEHLDFIGRIYGIEDRLTKAVELVTQFDLIDKFDAGATTLSRGMRQKLAVCCAYLANPQVLLLDEPLTGLDPPGIRSLLESLAVRAHEGATIVVSSHLLAMIEDVCTHLLVMQSGRSVFFGPANDFRKQSSGVQSLEEAYFAKTDNQPVEMVVE